MQIRDAGCGLTGQSVDVPELGGVCVEVEDVVQAEARTPAAGKGVMKIAVPFPVAGTSHPII